VSTTNDFKLHRLNYCLKTTLYSTSLFNNALSIMQYCGNVLKYASIMQTLTIAPINDFNAVYTG